MKLQQTLSVLDEFVKEWIENIQELKQFRVDIEPDYNDDPSGVPELAKDFPIYEAWDKWLEIIIKNEREELLILSFNLDNKQGVFVKFHIFEENLSLNFKGDISIYKSIIKLIHRFPETIKYYHRQYILSAIKEKD